MPEFLYPHHDFTALILTVFFPVWALACRFVWSKTEPDENRAVGRSESGEMMDMGWDAQLFSGSEDSQW